MEVESSLTSYTDKNELLWDMYVKKWIGDETTADEVKDSSGSEYLLANEDNDIANQSLAVSSFMSPYSELSTSPSQNFVDFFSQEHDDGKDFVIEDSNSDGMVLSPLQLLNGMEAIDFESNIKRSPISLSIELEPFNDVCYLNTIKGGEIKQDATCCFSPPPSRVLEMISTPVNKKRCTTGSERMNESKSTVMSNLIYQFQARPAENGVFVMNQQRCSITATNTPAAVPKCNKKKLNPNFKRSAALKEDYEQTINERDQPKWKRIRQLEPHEVDVRSSVPHYELLCRCTKTKCLKLYCDCFQAGKVCNGYCECTKCKNTQEESGPNGVRTRMIKEILKRRPNAFQRRAKDPESSCACKSSRCLKKYCQCFVHGRYCSNSCECQNCLNMHEIILQRNSATTPPKAMRQSQKKRPSQLLKNEDDLSHSSSHSTNFNALDALIESSTSSSTMLKGSFPPTTSLANEQSLTSSSIFPTAMTNVPPPTIPDIFKSTIPFYDPMRTPRPSSQLQPLEIPAIFRNSTTSASIPSEVFTNPHFWLKANNWGMEHTATKEMRIPKK